MSDAAPPDAAHQDASLADAGPPVTRWYVFDSVAVPRSEIEAMSNSVDVDGDGESDNLVGRLFATINQDVPYSVGAQTAAALASARLIALASVRAPPVEVGIRRGADLDGDPGDNFSGQEAFAVTPLEGADGNLYGTLEAGELVVGPGHAPVQLAFGPDLPVLSLSALAARVRCQVEEGGLASGILEFALTRATVTDIIVPALTDGLNAALAADCTSPTDPYCEAGSDGERILTYFDDDQDGSITSDEVEAISFIQAIISNPDLDLLDADGMPSPQGDGINDSLSFGFGFTAVGAVIAE